MADQYDIIIIGGGPGGYVAAIRAAQLGLKTAIVEKERLGGICLNWGCIPTKALLRNAEVLQLVKQAGRFGITIPEYTMDFAKVIQRSRGVADRLSKGVQFLMKKNGIDVYNGRAKLIDRHTVRIESPEPVHPLTAKNIVIASGGRPQTFPGLEIDAKRVIGSRQALVLDKPPRSLTIIGAGAIGVEFAYFYAMFGTKVYLVEMQDRVLPVEDREISRELEKSFIKSGVVVKTGTTVNKIQRLKTKVKVHIQSGSETDILESDYALVAVGVTGNVENLGLEKVGIAVERGAIVVDEYCRTSVAGVYAIGDVTGPPWLAHVASAQGHVAVEHAAGGEPAPLDYQNIPGCTYCQPQVASLGLTEEKALEEGRKIRVGRFPFRANGKSLAMGESTGFVKIIFDDEYGELLGCHIIGTEATEMIAELSVARALETTWEEIATTVHAHPTLSEAIMEAALDAYGQAVHQ
ncbi:MAG: dihydrolipoyl dehydrogenase [Fidelibacterota bacterium]